MPSIDTDPRIRERAMTRDLHVAPASMLSWPLVDRPAEPPPEARHRACWYSRRTERLPADLAFHHTIEDGFLLYCAHPMLLPVVGYQFDVRNCDGCDYFKPAKVSRSY